MTFVVNDLPDVSPTDYPSPAAYRFAQAVRELLQTRCGLRGPTEEQMVLRRELEGVGLITFSPGGPGQRTPIKLPPGGLPGAGPTEPDLTPPDSITGLTVTTLVAGAFLQWDPPTYTQGGGNSITEIFEAVYSGTGPLPTFGSAFKIGSVPFGTEVFVANGEPGTQRHYWVRAVTTYDVTQATPTGGVNGVSVVIGQIDGAEHIVALSIGTALIGNLAVTNAKIATVSVDKLIAGTLQVGAYMRSSNFVSGVQGFYIGGDGTLEVTNGTFRGYIAAGSGLIGGALIDASGVESDNYAADTIGWRLDNDDGLFAAQGKIGGFTLGGKKQTLGTATLAGTGSGIAMGTDTDTLNKLFVGNAASDFMYFNGTQLTYKGTFESYSASIAGGSVSVTVGNGLAFYANRTVTVTGGRSPYTYQWFVAYHDNEDDDTAALILALTGSPQTIGISGRATDSINTGSVVCTVTDANGRAITVGVPVSATHGTPP